MTDKEMEMMERALRQVRGTVIPVEDPARINERRPQLLSVLEREIQEVPRRRARHERWIRRTWAAASVAAVLTLAWGTTLWIGGDQAQVELSRSTAGAQLRSWSGDVRMGPPGHEETLLARAGQGVEQAALGVTSSLSTRESGHVELELPGAVQVEVNSNTQLQLLDAQVSRKHLRLARGRVDVQVPKPTDGVATRVLVTTPDAEVEVRGTVFSVEVRPSRHDASVLVTDVTVTRGSVAIRHQGQEHLVSAGSQWTSEEPQQDGRSSASDSPEPDSPESGLKASPKAGSSSEARSLADTEKTAAGTPQHLPKASKTAASTLAEQNRLFERALQARDQGQWDQVVRLCDQFLAQYPDSALVESVRSERAAAKKNRL